MESLLAFLLENWPNAIWLLVGGLIAYLYFKLTSHSSKSKEIATDAHSKINKLPCEAHNRKLGEIDAIKAESIQAKDIATEAHVKIGKLPCESHSQKLGGIDSLNGKVDVLLGLMQGKGSINFVQGHSPLAITKEGNAIAVELEMGKFISQKWDAISQHIESNAGPANMNPYDIQQLCFNYVLENPVDVLTDSGYDRLKVKAFNIGTSSAGLLQIASILIRDKYFEDHGINIYDIDKHDPTGKLQSE